MVKEEKSGESTQFIEQMDAELLGWEIPAARLLPPGEFLPAFEHFKMMAELDRWVVRSALKTLARGGPRNTIRQLGVNVSSQAIEEPGFAAFVATQLRQARLAPASLVFEIDESAAAKLKAIVRVGEVTGVGVIAECVEEDKVLAALRLLKVGYAQGFGVRKPEPMDDLFRS